jgi:hypothetical protein
MPAAAGVSLNSDARGVVAGCQAMCVVTKGLVIVACLVSAGDDGAGLAVAVLKVAKDFSRQDFGGKFSP